MGDVIDGIVYDGKKPNKYLSKFAIGLQAESLGAGTAKLRP
jgi:hypothetical protein